MRNIFVGFILCYCLGISVSNAQEKQEIKPNYVAKGKLLGTSKPLRDIKTTRLTRADKGKKKYKEIANFSSRKNSFPIDRNLNPKIDPLWKDGKVMTRTKAPQTTSVLNMDGNPYTGVNPPDPSIDVDSNYIVQMVNGSSGTMMRIWDKFGNLVYGPTTLNNFWSSFNVSGLGDPIVMYDNIADRWFISEFSSTGNFLLIAISQTNDPTGQYYAYQFSTPDFPDYPKYSVWPDAYYCTTNEGGDRTIYALDRAEMLAGGTPTMQRFTAPNLFAFGFHAFTPVDFDGVNQPGSLTKASFWRHVDDEAHVPGGNIATQDYVEYWELSPNFTTPNNSLLSGPFQIGVSEFDSDINGYTAFSGIVQPGNITLDPLREVFMQRMQYINFGTHESIVGCHVTDVNGQDRAGIRWYEFRKQPTGWTLYQEGTYSPTSENRWMGSISQDLLGNIAIAYSVASSTTYPSLRYTGRSVNDPLGQMTLTEQSIVAGTASNNSFRYGDYADMALDPSNGTFWFTGEYNPTSNWSTRIIGFSLSDTCNALNASGTQTATLNCSYDTTGEITITASGGNTGSYTYSIDQINFQNSNTFSGLGAGSYNVTVRDGSGCEVTSAPISVNAPNPIGYVVNTNDVLCHGEEQGNILITAFGGIGNVEIALQSNNYGLTNYFDSLAAGTYFIYLQDFNGCTDTTTAITINEPTPISSTLDIIPEHIPGSADGEITIHASGGTPPYQYAIVDTSSFQMDSLFMGLSVGSYTYYIKDANECLSNRTFEILLSSIEDFSTELDYEILPNPTNGKFLLKMQGLDTYEQIQIDLVDALGKQIRRINKSINSDQIQVEFSLEKFSKGIYFLNIQYQGEIKSFKVVYQ